MTTTVRCAHCGQVLERGAKLCPDCGAATRTCGTCGEQLAAEDRFCPACGTRTPAPGTLSPPESGPAVSWSQFAERVKAATKDYQILAELGRGGMAAVFLAHEPALNRRVAIKVMSPNLMVGDALVGRFRQEAQVVARLTHPNIVTIHAIREEAGLYYLVMKYVEGNTLETLIRDHGALSLNVSLALLGQIGSALSYAHRHAVVHRDIKPGNIIIDGEGEAIVTDFGIAKVAEAVTVTTPGEPIGTPAYMSPEQCEGAEVTSASDQYSFGIMAYEMLTGQRPFQGTNLAVMRAHVDLAPPPIAKPRSGIPAPVQSAIMRMLAKNPVKRFPSMADAVIALGAEPMRHADPTREQIRNLARMPLVAVSTPVPTPPALAPPANPSQTPGSSEPTIVTGQPRPAPSRARFNVDRRLLALGGALVLVLVIAAVAFRTPKPPPPAPPPALTFEQRLAAAAPGEEVALSSGTVEVVGTLRITKPVVIVGRGQDSTILATNADTAVVVELPEGGQAMLRGISLSGVGSRGPGVVVRSGRLDLTGMTLGGPGPMADCSEAKPGILFLGTSDGTIANSRITGFCTGVQVMDSAAPALQHNVIEANETGIRYFGATGGQAIGNQIRNNRTDGVSVRGGSPTLTENDISANGGYGIYWSASGNGPQGLLKAKNRISGNGSGDVGPRSGH